MSISLITTDISCMRCGQALRGLHPKSRCPKCELPVVNSLRVTKLECPGCGHANRALTRACSECGHSLLPDAVPDGPDDVDWPLNADCPCIQCGYNLRGLKGTGRCPECGRDITDTLRLAEQIMLCPTCLTPNPEVAVLCKQCGCPLTGAAATANYYRATPTTGSATGRRRKLSAEKKPVSPEVRSWQFQFVASLVALVIIAVFAPESERWAAWLKVAAVVYVIVCVVQLIRYSKK